MKDIYEVSEVIFELYTEYEEGDSYCENGLPAIKGPYTVIKEFSLIDETKTFRNSPSQYENSFYEYLLKNKFIKKVKSVITDFPDYGYYFRSYRSLDKNNSMIYYGEEFNYFLCDAEEAEYIIKNGLTSNKNNKLQVYATGREWFENRVDKICKKKNKVKLKIKTFRTLINGDKSFIIDDIKPSDISKV